MLILGLESSCDETAAAVLEDGSRLLADVINSQIEVHSRYGGVVPEIASRKHVENLVPVVEEALGRAGVTLADIDGIAVTQGPGLVGCLLVAHSFAKAVSFVRKIPYVGVDHMAGHLLAIFLGPEKPDFPYLALAVSGGHTSLYRVNGPLDYHELGSTRDDAAGEAFDKVAKLLGLGYPGGPVVSKLARGGDPAAIPFPRARLAPDSLDFSFSGLKTAVAGYLQNLEKEGVAPDLPAICASFQEAVAEVLVEKTLAAARQQNLERIVLAGGVGANPRLRELLAQKGTAENKQIFLPEPRFCTDNAAMIALAGHFAFEKRATLSYDTDVYSRSPVS